MCANTCSTSTTLPVAVPDYMEDRWVGKMSPYSRRQEKLIGVAAGKWLHLDPKLVRMTFANISLIGIAGRHYYTPISLCGLNSSATATPHLAEFLPLTEKSRSGKKIWKRHDDTGEVFSASMPELAERADSPLKCRSRAESLISSLNVFKNIVSDAPYVLMYAADVEN